MQASSLTTRGKGCDLTVSAVVPLPGYGFSFVLYRISGGGTPDLFR